MTRPAVCLRCDWEGETRAATCPNCGVRLYRQAAAPKRSGARLTRLRARFGQASAAEPSAGAGPVVSRGPLTSLGGARPGAEASSEVESVGRWGTGKVLIAFTVLAVVAAVWFVQRHTPAPSRPHTGEVGSIVYEARSSDGQPRLYRWDLVANVVHRGPLVHDLLDLVDASGAHPGWVGASWGAPAGGVDIGVFKFLGPDDQALPLGHGDVAAWAPQGVDAAVGTARPASSGCARLYVLAIRVATLRKQPTAGERLCATIQDMELSQRVTYLSLLGSQGRRIAFLSVGRLRPVLPRYRLNSLSPANDMVVTPDAPVGSSPAPGAALYFRGPVSQSPTPYSFNGAPFVLDRVLSWDPSATEALALGSAAGRTGIFRLPAAPPEGPTQPVVYVSPASGYSDALYTGEVGTRIVFSGGLFSRVFEGSSAPFPMPPGAPVPTGPMVWIGS